MFSYRHPQKLLTSGSPDGFPRRPDLTQSLPTVVWLMDNSGTKGGRSINVLHIFMVSKVETSWTFFDFTNHEHRVLRGQAEQQQGKPALFLIGRVPNFLPLHTIVRHRLKCTSAPVVWIKHQYLFKHWGNHYLCIEVDGLTGFQGGLAVEDMSVSS